MIKKLELGYRGMSKDLAKDKQDQKYFDAKNVRILATDKKSSFSVTNEDGNELIFDIPDVQIRPADSVIRYTVNGVQKEIFFDNTKGVTKTYSVATDGLDQSIIGVKEMRDSAIIVSTNRTNVNCFWELKGLNNGKFDLELLYVNDLKLYEKNILQILYNYENSIIEKIYFVDGINQLRFMNIRQSKENGDLVNLIDADPSSIDVVSTFELSSPIIDDDSVVTGGSHTSGMVQYAYSLYILNGSQTVISPGSRLVPIDKGEGAGGGEVNEVLGKSVLVSIPELDESFTHIKLYSIKYTSFNQEPEILEVADQEIGSYSGFQYYDDGVGGTPISLEAFAFLGADPIIPQHISTKDNILFPANIKENKFDVDMDLRAYSHNSQGDAFIYDNVFLDQRGNPKGSLTKVEPSRDYKLAKNSDAINLNYDINKYQADGSTLGAEGNFLKVELVQTSLPYSKAKNLRFFKDNEIYRLGIILYNRRGQETPVKWVMDFRAPQGNLDGNYNQLKVELKPSFYSFVNNIPSDSDERPIGYRIVRAERTISDRTILAQGVINGMMANHKSTESSKTASDGIDRATSNEALKMPSVMRMFENKVPFVRNYDFLPLEINAENTVDIGQSVATESFRSDEPGNRKAQTFQFNRLMQMYSPEVVFNNLQIDSSFKLKPLGLAREKKSWNWSAEVEPVTEETSEETIFEDGFTTATPGVTENVIKGHPSNLSDNGFYGPSGGSGLRAMHQIYRDFTEEFIRSSKRPDLEVYGSPEITKTGEDSRLYNNDPSLRYANNLKSMLLDNFTRKDQGGSKDSEVQILGLNSVGIKCITFAEGDDNSNTSITSRLSIGQIYNRMNISETDGVIIAEFKKGNESYYVGSSYGGFSFEAKQSSNYIGIGEYKSVDSNSIFIESPGDTFVQEYKFAKTTKSDERDDRLNFNILTEIVNVKLESTVDLKNRNDLSLSSWDARFHPKQSEYAQYNNVYSQEATLLKSTSTGFKFKKVVEFDARFMASKTKVPGENVDSWTDFLVNENMDLDGKYGPINEVVNLRDEVYALQDTAVAKISINPRIQTTGSDGVAIELGTGGILHDYEYLTTTSGCLSKRGALSSGTALYYFDIINRSIVKIGGQGVIGLSDQEGFRSFFENNIEFSSIRFNDSDKFLISNGLGISTGYNSANDDIFFSFHQEGDKSFTLAYNEKAQAFTSFYDYVPAWFLNKGHRMITTGKDNRNIWDHFKGEKGSFYGELHDSSVTFNASPIGKGDVTFNSAEFRMEMIDAAGNDLKNVGITKIRVYNEYQDTGVRDLALRKNMFKKNRNWKVNIPREQGGRERIKSPWAFMEFTFENKLGREMVMHDITVYYTEY